MILRMANLAWNSSSVATVCVGLAALLGDHVVAQEALLPDLRAIADNMTHGAIGLLSWHIVTAQLADLTCTTRVWEALWCGLLSSAVDLDHFVTARSLRIEDARQLPSRPPLHCTSVMLVVCGFLLMLAHVVQWPLLQRLSWILVGAVLSHHLRDAARRGLWLYPFGSSPPVPYTGYILGCMLLPHALPWLVRYTQIVQKPSPLYSVVSL